MEERIAISKQDLYRLDVLTNFQKKSLKQFQSAQIFAQLKTQVSGRAWYTCQVRRLQRRLEESGPKGLISKKARSTEHHQLSEEAIHRICS